MDITQHNKRNLRGLEMKDKKANQAYTPFLNDGAIKASNIIDFMRNKTTAEMSQISSENLEFYNKLKELIKSELNSEINNELDRRLVKAFNVYLADLKAGLIAEIKEQVKAEINAKFFAELVANAYDMINKGGAND